MPARMRYYRALAISILLLLLTPVLLLSHDKFSRAADELVVLLPKWQSYSHSLSFMSYMLRGFSWDDVKPSKTLVWHNCYSKLQCARLIVPLNYSDPNGEKAVIAMTRVPSPLGSNNKEYRGPILLNPGGPGGSGVDLVLRVGDLISAIVGPRFDILGFDPRGIGRSTPRVNFFETAVERELWSKAELAVLNATTGNLAREWARAKITGQLAKERQQSLLGHINTDQTATDMLSIVRAHGKEKLLYWGFSYGSVLGATYASMFPNNIERLVIDGVADIENYYQTLWSTNLLDTDKTMNSFYNFCHASGPTNCPFYAPTPDLIKANLTALYDKVRARPVTVRTATSYGIVDYDRLRLTVFSALYKPWAAFPALARGLADLAEGDGSSLFAMAEQPPFRCNCGEDSDDEKNSVLKDATTAIACNDGDPVPEAYEALEKYFKDLTSKSEWAELWASIRTSCVGWPDFPKARFRGPFEANTSFPLLVVGNTADPVTPLWAAKKTAKGFPGAVVLTQASPGHCSIAAPSTCTQSYIRDYFVKGTFPPPNIACAFEGNPFDPSNLEMLDQEKQLRHVQGVMSMPKTSGGVEEAEETEEENRVLRDAVRMLSVRYMRTPGRHPL